ncbi:hypothetical protein M2263_001653 [Providencia alcalifaciens]|nr:hypothetical protein [Providencia alcalifaciens]
MLALQLMQRYADKLSTVIPLNKSYFHLYSNQDILFVSFGFINKLNSVTLSKSYLSQT